MLAVPSRPNRFLGCWCLVVGSPLLIYSKFVRLSDPRMDSPVAFSARHEELTPINHPTGGFHSFLAGQSNWAHAQNPGMESKLLVLLVLSRQYSEWFKRTRFYPEMCLNGVNTQWVYSQAVIQKPLDEGNSVTPKASHGSDCEV